MPADDIIFYVVGLGQMGADLEVSFNENLFRATEICDVLMDDWNPTVGVDCRISIGF